MRFDMHCHTRYGSIDARVTITDYVQLLKEKGYDGMLVTDHDSYKGYNTWKKTKESSETDFIVLRGVEYDTRDAGHFIVVLPDGLHLRALSIRGMSAKALITLVHAYGGIVGSAHPFGVRCSSAMFFRTMKKNPQLIDELDFIEGLNTCESKDSNVLSRQLAAKHDKPTFGGSDSHDYKYVGMGYTDIDADIRCNDDLIAAVKKRKAITCGGTERKSTFKSKQAHAFYSVYGFMIYNFGLGIVFTPYRARQISKAFTMCNL